MEPKRDRYIPSLSLGWLTSFYDPLIRWTTREDTFKCRLVELAHIQNGQRVLDLGCGTATLTILMKQAHPGAEVIGLDGDPKILGIARAKIVKASLYITLNEGMAFELPYENDSFDRVVSSLVFHHLTAENKKRTLREVLRVLRPNGEFYLADFGKPANLPMYLISLIMRRLEETGDNINGLLPEMCREASFDPIEELDRFSTVFGTLSIYKAGKP